jgi:anti-sigma regulatory factor (Ser/Thr protein kinase)
VGEGDCPVSLPGAAVTAAISGSAGGGADRFGHAAFPYRGSTEYLDQIVPFVREGLACAEPVLVAVPEEDARLIRDSLGADASQPDFPDMVKLGRNPARITLALIAFADQHAGKPVRCVTEPMWPGRTGPEAAEVMRHEALVNLALAATRAQLLCPYRTSLLSPALLAEVRRTHPAILAGGARQPSGAYRQPPGGIHDPALSAPPPHVWALAYTSDLKEVRALVNLYAEGAGLPPERRLDLVLAVGEITANTLGHTGSGGTVHIWTADGQVICQVHDSGQISDPLVGRRRPPPHARGHGLWVVNEICDLVELRTGPAGTTIRLRMRLPKT